MLLARTTTGADLPLVSNHDEADSVTPRRWRTPQVPTDSVSGRATDEVAQLYRAEDFDVDVRNLDGDTRVTLELDPERSRLCTRDGLVVQVTRG
jgi:hypothetical protein